MNKHNTGTEGTIIKNGKIICTQITINAKPEKIWNVLIDFEQYARWNPFITSISGMAAKGKRLSVMLQQPGSSPMLMKPEVLNTETNRELRWIGRLMMPYIFDGEHTFKIQDNGDGTCTFTQYERFRGILLPFIKGMLNNKTIAGFRLMNEALKKRSEQL